MGADGGFRGDRRRGAARVAVFVGNDPCVVLHGRSAAVMVLHVYPESGRRDLRTVAARQSGTNLDGQKRHEVRNGQHTLSSSVQGACGAKPNPGGARWQKEKTPAWEFFLMVRCCRAGCLRTNWLHRRRGRSMIHYFRVSGSKLILHSQVQILLLDTFRPHSF